MLRKFQLVSVILIVLVCLVAPCAQGATPIGKIVLNESSYEKFGALYFPFLFTHPHLWVMCEFGVSAAGGCVNNVVSDVVCLTNNQAGEGVAAMISDLENGLASIPPDFPCATTTVAPKFIAETGKTQVLTTKVATMFPTGAPGPVIEVAVLSDLDVTTSTVSDVLNILSM